MQAVAVIAGTAAVAVVAALSGMGAEGVLLSSLVALVVLSLWSAYDLLPEEHARPEYALGLVMVVLAALLALSGSADPVQGRLAEWYSQLGFGFPRDISVDQFTLGAGAAVFLLATGNRLVRLTLAATEASLLKGEGTLRGGRVLGPMERLMVAAAVVSGGLAGAGFVVAAKVCCAFARSEEAVRPPNPRWMRSRSTS